MSAKTKFNKSLASRAFGLVNFSVNKKGLIFDTNDSGGGGGGAGPGLPTRMRTQKATRRWINLFNALIFPYLP